MGSRLTLDRWLVSSKRDRHPLGGEPNIRGHLVSGLPPRVPDLARSPCTPCLDSIRLLSAPVSAVPTEVKKAPARAFCCTYRRLCYGLLCLHAPFCCALRRLFKFLLYLQALFCCALRRLFAVPTGAFGHGSAALAFTHKTRFKDTGGARLPRSSRPKRAAHRRPMSRPRLGRPNLEMAVTADPFRIRTPGPVRPRQTSDRAGRRAEPGRLPRIGNARRHRIRTYAPPRDEPGRRLWLKKSPAVKAAG